MTLTTKLMRTGKETWLENPNQGSITGEDKIIPEPVGANA